MVIGFSRLTRNDIESVVGKPLMNLSDPLLFYFYFFTFNTNKVYSLRIFILTFELILVIFLYCL